MEGPSQRFKFKVPKFLQKMSSAKSSKTCSPETTSGSRGSKKSGTPTEKDDQLLFSKVKSDDISIDLIKTGDIVAADHNVTTGIGDRDGGNEVDLSDEENTDNGIKKINWDSFGCFCPIVDIGQTTDSDIDSGLKPCGQSCRYKSSELCPVFDGDSIESYPDIGTMGCNSSNTSFTYDINDSTKDDVFRFSKKRHWSVSAVFDESSHNTDVTSVNDVFADDTDSRDVDWERENAGIGTTILPTEPHTEEREEKRFKPPSGPIKRKGSRRLSLSTGLEFSRFRKRKHNKENDDEDDNVSVHSLDIGGSNKKKSKRSLLRVSASLANLISPIKHRNDGDGFKVPSSPIRQQSPSPYRPPLPSPAKRRVQVTWLDSVSNQTALSHTDIKRQEAIHELYQGEKDIYEDLENVKKLYRDSLLTLGLMSEDELDTLCGNIDDLTPVHQDLARRLQEQRRPDGTICQIGSLLYNWSSRLNVYIEYCANQIAAKALFDEKKNDSAIDDFLQRCIASPFSRKLDMWTLLDGARSRFVKYPLLIRSIQKYTPNDSDDAILLEKCVHQMEAIIKEADMKTGQAKCEHSKSSFVYLFDDQKISQINESSALLCNGCMKNNKNSKLFVFLFDKVVVISRSTNQNGHQMFQVYRQPIPTSELLVEDLPDGEVKMGSFRNAFGQGSQTGKNLIRLSFTDSEKGQSHTLMANDEHDKRQWMTALGKVTTNIVVVPETKGKDKQLNS